LYVFNNNDIMGGRLFICCLILSLNARAQLGVGAGTGLTWTTFNATGWPNSEERSGTGWLVAVPLQYRLHFQSLYIASGPNYVVREYTRKGTGSLTGTYETFRNGYLRLPFTVGVGYGRYWHWNAGAGGYVAYWTDGRVKGTTPDVFSARDSLSGSGQQFEQLQLVPYNTRYSFDSRRDRRFEFGWVLEAGLAYAATENYSLFIRGEYSRSLTSQEIVYAQEPAMTSQVLSLSIGLLLQTAARHATHHP
jgi:hypothetical protein